MAETKRAQDRLIMIVDDDADNLRLVAASLQSQGYHTLEVGSGEEALERLKTITPDLLLLDINMPGISGFDTLKQVRKQDNYISVIFNSGRSDPGDIIKGLDAGADDYISKPYDPLVMIARVKAQLRIKDLQDELAGANKKLKELIDIDDLTGLFNMRSIYERLDKEIYRARRYHRSVCVAMMDMDNFKTVNDTHDHLFGSFVLTEVGKMIQDTIRQVDFAARYGGDEFLIVLTETDAAGAQAFTERLRKRISGENFEKDGASMRLTASLGIACIESHSSDTLDARGLVRQADHALYQAKREGKNCVRLYTGGVESTADAKRTRTKS